MNAKFLRALNKTLKFDLQEDDHDNFGPSRQIAAQIFFKKALWAKQIRFLLMEWANYVAEKKWRNSVFRGNSSGRFLHGPLLNTCLREWKLLSLYMFHQIIFLLLIVSSLCCNFNRCAVCFQSLMKVACRSSQNTACIKRFWRLHIIIKPLNKK